MVKRWLCKHGSRDAPNAAEVRCQHDGYINFEHFTKTDDDLLFVMPMVNTRAAIFATFVTVEKQRLPRGKIFPLFESSCRSSSPQKTIHTKRGFYPPEVIARNPPIGYVRTRVSENGEGYGYTYIRESGELDAKQANSITLYSTYRTVEEEPYCYGVGQIAGVLVIDRKGFEDIILRAMKCS